MWASPKTVLDTLEAGPVGAVQIFCKHFDMGTGVVGGAGGGGRGHGFGNNITVVLPKLLQSRN